VLQGQAHGTTRAHLNANPGASNLSTFSFPYGEAVQSNDRLQREPGLHGVQWSEQRPTGDVVPHCIPSGATLQKPRGTKFYFIT
jgi:hypothetical protein